VPGEKEGQGDEKVVQPTDQDPESQRNQTRHQQVGKPHGEG
jgi:hypothetical protein